MQRAKVNRQASGFLRKTEMTGMDSLDQVLATLAPDSLVRSLAPEQLSSKCLHPALAAPSVRRQILAEVLRPDLDVVVAHCADHRFIARLSLLGGHIERQGDRCGN